MKLMIVITMVFCTRRLKPKKERKKGKRILKLERVDLHLRVDLH